VIKNIRVLCKDESEYTGEKGSLVNMPQILRKIAPGEFHEATDQEIRNEIIDKTSHVTARLVDKNSVLSVAVESIDKSFADTIEIEPSENVLTYITDGMDNANCVTIISESHNLDTAFHYDGSTIVFRDNVFYLIGDDDVIKEELCVLDFAITCHIGDLRAAEFIPDEFLKEENEDDDKTACMNVYYPDEPFTAQLLNEDLGIVCEITYLCQDKYAVISNSNEDIYDYAFIFDSQESRTHFNVVVTKKAENAEVEINMKNRYIQVKVDGEEIWNQIWKEAVIV
jgi:hypothetical protein